MGLQQRDISSYIQQSNKVQKDNKGIRWNNAWSVDKNSSFAKKFSRPTCMWEYLQQHRLQYIVKEKQTG